MRELVTIGGLGLLGAASPNARSRLRRMSYVRHAMIRSIGQTNPNFAPGVTADTAGQPLQDAAASLLNYLDTNGVPSEHVNDANVEAFQTMWNADPGNAAANAKLSPDGGYGANVHDALNILTGGIAPAVNTGGGPAPAPAPSPAKPTPSTPTAPTHTAGMSGGALLLLLAAAAGVGYLVFGRKKRMTSVVVRRNPRRARRRRML